MLERIRLRPALLGAAVTVAVYLVVMVSLVPASAGLLVEGGPAVVTAVVIAGTLLGPLLGGLASVRALRRHGQYPRRAAALPTLVVTGLVASLLVVVVTAAAQAAAGQPAVLAGAAATAVTLTLATLPVIALVRPAPEGQGYVARPTGRRLRGARGDAGQGSLEAVGVTAVAAILVVSLIVVMAPGGTWLGDNVRTQLCRIITLGQGDCGGPADLASQVRPEPEHACVQVDSSDDRGVSVSVMWVQAEGGALIRVEELSDGTFRVSREGSAGLGAQADTGGGLTVTVDGTTVGGEAQASASAQLNLGAGATWVVDEAEKDRLVDYLKTERNWESLQMAMSSAGPLGGFAAALATGGRAVWNWLTDAYTPPMPDEVYGYGGVSGNAGAAASGLVQHADASISAGGVLGSRLDVKNQQLTVYYEGQLDLGAGYQAHLEGSEAGFSGTVRPLVAVTYDPDGNPLSVQVQAMAAGEAKLTVGNMFGEPFIDENPNGGFVFDARVSITNDETRDIAMGLLKASGIATPNPVARYQGAAEAVDTFVTAARERGTLTRQTITAEGNTDFAAALNAKVAGVGFGGSFANSTETITTTDADYWDGSRWRTWSSCLS